MGVVIDHLILCVPDLEDAASELASLGLSSVPGGRHQGHGTANRIVPLGENYLELVTVIDGEEAAGSVFGTWVAGRVSASLEVDLLALRTDDLAEVCSRLGIEPEPPMSRVRPDGIELTWELAGLNEALVRSLPFFIQWHVPDEDLPGAAPIDHSLGEVRLEEVMLTGDVGVLSSWTAGTSAIRLESGTPGSGRATLSTSSGPLTI